MKRALVLFAVLLALLFGPIGNRLKRMPDRDWSRAFDGPIPLPRGRHIRTHTVQNLRMEQFVLC
jgi:hypothetical protein